MDNRSDGESSKKIKNIVNMIPGSLIYKGVKKEKFSLERIIYNNETYKVDFYPTYQGQFENDTKSIPPNFIQWINVTGINNINEIEGIGKCFNINPIVLEQVLDVSKNSLYGMTEDYIFNNLQMIYLKDDVIKNESVSIYLVDNTLITFQERQGDVFDSIRTRIKNNEGYIRNENNFYSYFCLLDALVDHYNDVLENVKTDVEKMELRLMEKETLDNKKLHTMRKEIFIIKLNASPIEKLIQELSKSKNSALMVQEKYFESVAQNIRYAIQEVAILKASVDNLYETYMMTNADNMNQVMTILTIFSAVFIPLSFAAGVFGMNFTIMPGVDNPSAFIYFVMGCFLTAAVLLSVFKYKKWF